MSRSPAWYLHRARRMSPREVVARASDERRKLVWARRQVRPGAPYPRPSGMAARRPFAATLPAGLVAAVAPDVRAGVVAAAERLLAGDWTLLGTPRPDVAAPDWFLDPGTGRRAPQETLAFRVDHRDEALTGNVKTVWELSRHHHLTVLAAAWWLTHDERYAETVAAQLRSWWAENPFLSGVHWTSGIELGVRLVSWAWIRRFLDEWPGVDDLFGDDAATQIWWHQVYLAGFRSSGSSANNHVVAEEAGRLVAACAFPWFAESDAWREDAARALAAQLARNTFASGINRELATDYHRFVTELGVVAAVEADAAGTPLGEETWALLTRSFDAAAAVLDCAGRPPRQNDGDDGRVLVLGHPETDEPWADLLGIGDALVGRVDWWPRPAHGCLAATVLGALAPGRRTDAGRPATRPDDFADAGMTLLRTVPGDGPEIWCRCDGGPHGFLSIAAHAHADALSVEVRYGGVEVLVDPGTYCYHGEPAWRRYFRSTRGHNTVSIDGVDQSVDGGPFLWTRHARTEVDRVPRSGEDPTWAAHHTGYERLTDGVRHDREVTLSRARRSLTVGDVLTTAGEHDVELCFHLGPTVDVDLAGSLARLSWTGPDGREEAVLELPATLGWSTHRGETAPVRGWYSPAFGVKEPTTVLVGAGRVTDRLELRSVLTFGASAPGPAPDHAEVALSAGERA